MITNAPLEADAACPHDERAMNPNNDKFWLLAALFFGVLVLPFLVHVTGVHVLGTYSGGGAIAFYGDFLRGLVGLRWYSWTLALGPCVLVGLWRAFARLLLPHAATDG
jgi:hypothetical protein